jgi:zinc protease
MNRSALARVAVWGGLAATLLAGCAAGTSRAGASREASTPSREVLANGMRLVVQERHASGVVALELWIGVGGRDEAPAERGYSHLVEHMLFKGTAARPRGFVDREVEAVGGRTNAGTSYDYTFYYLVLPVARAARGIEMLADMAFDAAFDPEELARERAVVFEEGRRGEDDPRVSLSRRLQELVFDGHPYGLPLLGDPAALRNATRASLRAYYARNYVPERMSLVVVGAVDPAEIRAAVDRSFGAVLRAGGERTSMAAPRPLDADRREEIARAERQAGLGLGWQAPEVGARDMFAVDLLAQILGGSRSSRLNQALRERAHLVASVTASYAALARAGVFMVAAQLEPSDLREVEAGVLDEVRRLQDDGVTAEEVALAATAVESRYLFSRETVEGLALALGRAETVWSLQADSDYLDRIRSVTPEQIRDAAQRYLGAPHATVVQTPRPRPS